MHTELNVAIIGGGSGGLFAGVLLAKNPHIRVAVYERLDRVGKKLLATGNGQGNLSNQRMDASHYHGDTALAERVFGQGYAEKTDAVWQELGVSLCADERGRVYPVSRQASSVLDMLRRALLLRGGKEITGAEIIRIVPQAAGFTLHAKDGRTFTADKVVIATGGCSGQGMGTDGAFYKVLRGLGHSVTPVTPSLVQLKTDTAFLKNLKGVRIHASLSAEGITECGDVLFTDTGVSGDTAFRLSAKLKSTDGGALTVDFLPHLTQSALQALLKEKYRSLPDYTAYELLCTLLHKQVIKNLLRMRGIQENGRVSEKEFVALAPLMKAYPLTLKGTAGFAQSQVTKGGIPAAEIHAGTLESKRVPGMYFVGEVLNVDGDCGGYNLQWAFSSAHLVADVLLQTAKKGASR